MSNRPASFDAAVMAYVPGLHNLAKRYKPRQYRDDLVTDTLISAFTRWQSYRPDGNMWQWLRWTMLSVIHDQAVRAATKMRSGVTVTLDKFDLQATQPTQHDAAELSSTLSVLRTVKDGDILLRRAMGESLNEIADSMGITGERVRQREDKARGRLRKAVAEKVAA